MFLPNGVKLTLTGTHDDPTAALGCHVWAETVAEGQAAVRFFEAMGVTVESATVREVETRKVPLEGWKIAKVK